MIVKLKCGEVYSFNKIDFVKFYAYEFIEIKANFKKGGRKKPLRLSIDTISNMGNVYKYLKNYGKTIKDYEGLCPKCNSENVSEIGYSKHFIPLNDNKGKKAKYEKHKILGYMCLDCKEKFKELKECEIEIYYM